MQKHTETLISIRRKNNDTKYLTKEEIKKLGSSLLKLQRGLTGDRNLAGKNYMQDPLFFGAYLLYYWNVSYIQIEKILEKISVPAKNSFSILECGSGPAPGTCAILDKILDKNPAAKIEVFLTDSSGNALKTAEKIISRDYKNVSVTTKVSNLEKDEIPEGKYDFILLSHVLNELWKNQENKIDNRFEYVSKLSKKLTQDGMLILNEPSILEASRNLIMVRDKLLENGMKLLSPCPESECTKCPVLETPNHTCHAEYFISGVKILDDLSREAGLNRVSVKMSYFVFNASTIGIPPEGVAEGNEGESRKYGKRDGEAGTPQKTNVLKGKIVSEGMLNKSGRVRFLVCNGKERIPLSAKQNDTEAKKQGFFSLKRYDNVEIANPEVRENGFGMTGATLKIVKHS